MTISSPCLIDIAPRHRDNPRIVLLTPGPYNATYFERADLARYLGYTLAEGLVRLLRSMWMRVTDESKPGASAALPALSRAGLTWIRRIISSHPMGTLPWPMDGIMAMSVLSRESFWAGANTRSRSRWMSRRSCRKASSTETPTRVAPRWGLLRQPLKFPDKSFCTSPDPNGAVAGKVACHAMWHNICPGT